MKVRKKIADIYTTKHEMERIKVCVLKSKGRMVQWEKHRDGRKRQQICSGVIGDAFANHFTVKLTDGWKTSFNYIDLLIGDVVLMDVKTGRDILKVVDSVTEEPTWDDIKAMEIAQGVEVY